MKTTDKRQLQKRALSRRPQSVFLEAIVLEVLSRAPELESTLRRVFAEEFQRFESSRSPELESTLRRVFAEECRHFESGVLSRLPEPESTLRRVFVEEFRHFEIRITEVCNSYLPKQITGPPPERRLKLKFITNPKPENYTEKILEAESGDNMKIALFDENDKPMTTAQESNAILDVVLLRGDFNTDNWTRKEFENQIENGREGKGQLLVGDLIVHVREGVGTLGNLRVMDNSSWTRSKKFRLGVWVSVENPFWGTVVREGKSLPFSVKEKRGIGQKKHDKPALEDKVWRLEKILRSGKYHMKFNDYGIYTVRDFVVYNQVKPNKLKTVMLLKHYQATVEHAQSCELGTLFVHNIKEAPHETVIFNNKHELIGIFRNDIYTSIEMLENSDKTRVDFLVKAALYDQTYTEESYVQENQITSGIWETGECSHSLLDKSYERGGFSHHQIALQDVENPGIWETGECSHSVLPYVVEQPETQRTSLLDASYESGAFSNNHIGNWEAMGITNVTAEFSHSNSQQDNYIAQQGLVGNDVSIHNNIMIENDTQEFSQFSWDLNTIPNSEFLCINDWFVGDPIDSGPNKDANSSNSRMWLKIRTFIRCALLIRSTAHSSSSLHRNLTYRANFQNPLVC